MWDYAAGEIPFIDGGDNFYRWLISNATDYGGWTASTSPMMDSSTTIGQYWNWVDFQSLAPTVSLMQPQLSLAFVDRGPILQPLVQVQCSAYTSNTSNPDFSFPNDQLRASQGNAYANITWPVPSNYTDINNTEYSEDLFWAKLPVDGYENRPSAGLIFIMPNDNWTRTVVPCSVVAHWVPNDLSVLPTVDRNIHAVYSNPLDLVNRSDVLLAPSTQVALSDEWWTLMNAGDPMAMNMAIQGITGQPCDGCLHTYYGGTQGLAYRVSTIVGMLLTDAIARYVCHS